MPAPHHLNYAATKVFDDFFSKSLFYELRPKGVDVLTVNPGMVATAMTRRKVDLKQLIISSEECARGCLDKATSFQTYGGNWHELSGLIAKCLLIDLLPMTVALNIGERVGRKIKEEQ
jgi:NAD(P)-dependent dehydrogenase (short-subunit alcohol dehydrogenase family)